jgi:hypothetical protein
MRRYQARIDRHRDRIQIPARNPAHCVDDRNHSRFVVECVSNGIVGHAAIVPGAPAEVENHGHAVALYFMWYNFG